MFALIYVSKPMHMWNLKMYPDHLLVMYFVVYLCTYDILWKAKGEARTGRFMIFRMLRYDNYFPFEPSAHLALGYPSNQTPRYAINDFTNSRRLYVTQSPRYYSEPDLQ